MQKQLLIKLALIAFLSVLMTAALSMINATIDERANFRQQAVHEIASESVREQTLAGPVLVLRYIDEYEEQVAIADDKQGRTRAVTQRVGRQTVVFPEQLNVNGRIETDRRYRGLHQILVYTADNKLNGHFRMPPMSELTRATPGSRLSALSATLVVAVSDVRGIRSLKLLKIGGKDVAFKQGSGLAGLPAGVHAVLPQTPQEAAAQLPFSLELSLDGIERFHVVPAAADNRVAISSNWPHPQFGGAFLPHPRNRSITEQGFSAQWNISSLSTTAQQGLAAAAAAREAMPGAPEHFSIGLIEPVDIYVMASRAVKYGILFVGLTFAAFFLFEMLKRLPIHPLQYLLVGLALALFFLLLVSLSEHMAFGLAYAMSGAACILLIGYYLSFVLRDWRRGWAFAAGLALLYSALYGLLISENNALVAGSLLLFAILAAVMVATRKVDWYQVGKAQVGAQ